MMTGRRNVLWQMGIVGLVAVAGGLTWSVSDARSPSDGVKDQRQAVSTLGTNSAPNDLQGLVSQALQENCGLAAAAIEELRRRGPVAVNYLINQTELRKSPRWSEVLDAAAQQKDAHYRGLYWYTDLDQALAVAKRENKPVLSLRLLGKLTDELSCANSRFFRTTLYPNPKVRDLLANQFVLHWQSVRSVPIITIDFGDGRKIQRTITGNSLHLVLDEQGRPIDVLPGLYTASSFSRELQQAGPAALQLATVEGDEFRRRLSEFHRGRLEAARWTWEAICQKAKLIGSLEMGIDYQPDVWTKIAMSAEIEPVLDGSSQFAVAERAAPREPDPPAAEVAGKVAATKMVAETPAMRLIRNVSQVIREDSLRNEYHLHVKIHGWFAAMQPPPAGESLVTRVYSELFLSPLNDPWYGLSKPDVFSALKNDGRIHAVTQNSGH